MPRILIANANVFDATGTAPFTGDVLVEGNRIVSVSPKGSLGGGGLQADHVIHAAGKFLMPGMVEGHAHLSFENVTATEDLITPFPEQQVFTAARGAKALIDAGFTSAYGAAEAKLRGRNVDPAVFDRAAAGLRNQPGGAAMDTVVLACTHFPLVADELAAAFGPGVNFVHGAEGIARRIAHLTEGQDVRRSQPDIALFTRDDPSLTALTPLLARHGLETIAFF